MSATWMNKLHSIAPCCPFHTSPPCIHVRHTLPCLNLPILGIHREGEGSLVLPQPFALTQSVLYLGLTRQSYLLLQPVPVSTELTKHLWAAAVRCTCFPWMSYMHLAAFYHFAPNPSFHGLNTQAVFATIFLSPHSTQHSTLLSPTTHLKSKYCWKVSVLFA